jgi:hypothetical protein
MRIRNNVGKRLSLRHLKLSIPCFPGFKFLLSFFLYESEILEAFAIHVGYRALLTIGTPLQRKMYSFITKL